MRIRPTASHVLASVLMAVAISAPVRAGITTEIAVIEAGTGDGGRLIPGASRIFAVSLHNTGAGTATITDITIEGDDAAAFSVYEFSPTLIGYNVSPGEGRLELVFAPTTLGAKAATVLIEYDVSKHPDNDERVTATASLSGSSVNASPGLVASPTEWDFGDIAFSDEKRKSFFIQNVSPGPITFAGHEDGPGDLGIRVVSLCPSVLAAGNQCTVSLYAQGPYAGDTESGSVHILSSDAHPVLVLSGTATGLPLPPPPDTRAPEMESLDLAVEEARLPSATRVKVQISWAASDAIGVAGYTAQWRVPGGAWVTLVDQRGPFDADAVPDTTEDAVVPVGSIELRARARDRAGNVSAWRRRTVTITYIDLRAGNATYTGSWSRVQASRALGGSVMVGTSRRQSVILDLKARSIALIARRSPLGGTISVTIDGEGEGNVPLSSATLGQPRVVFTWGRGGSARLRRIELSENAPPGPVDVHLDGFIITR